MMGRDPEKRPNTSYTWSRRRLLGGLGLLGMTPVLSGCSGLLPGQRPPPQLYRLLAPYDLDALRERPDLLLAVARPATGAALDTMDIAIFRDAQQLSYYAKVGWSDAVPDMLQSLLVESLLGSEALGAVTRQGGGLHVNRVLRCDLQHFEVQLYPKGAEAVVAWSAGLVEMPRRRLRSTRSFATRVPLQDTSVDTAVAGFNQAVQQLINETIDWVLTEG